MAYTNLLYHIVFGTKGREPIISREIMPQFHRYLGGIVRGLGGIALEIGVRNQERHHKKFDFKTEFESLLENNSIPVDDYVWQD